MKITLSLLLLNAAFGSLAIAQEYPEGDIFFGFSVLRASSAKTILANTSIGGVGTLAININDHIAVEGEFGGYHNGLVDDFHDDTNSVTYLFGPRISYGRSKRIGPYFHTLIGGIHTGTSVLKQPAPTQLPTGSSPRSTMTQDGLTIAIGGGVDIRLGKMVSFRPVQFDYVLTRLGDIGAAGLSASKNQSNLRYTLGLVFNFTER